MAQKAGLRSFETRSINPMMKAFFMGPLPDCGKASFSAFVMVQPTQRPWRLYLHTSTQGDGASAQGSDTALS